MAEELEGETDVGYLTVRQAAKKLNIRYEALYQAIREGRLASYQVMGKKALRHADVEAYQPRNYRDRRSSEPVQQES